MLLALLLACGASEALPPPRATVGAPWSTLDLPLDEATVLQSRDATLHLQLPAGPLRPGPWVRALERHGWEGQVAGVHDDDLRDVVLVDATGATLVLGFRRHEAHTRVTLARTPSPRAVTP